MDKAIFLDRDGTLIKDYPDLEWANVVHPEIFPDTITTLRNAPRDYLLFIVTNQYLIGEGIITLNQFLGTHRELISKFEQSDIAIEQTYFCPHARAVPCGCHKPGKGMIEQCLVNYDIDLSQSYFIGDSESDMALAQSVGCIEIAVRDYAGAIQPTYYAENLLDAFAFITNRSA